MVSIRPSKDQTFIEIAMSWSKQSTCSTRIAVGAVLVNNRNQIIASGYNGAPVGFKHCNDVGCDLDKDGHCLRSIHAEENAILQCAVNGVSSLGTRIYVTHSPCLRCAMRIIQAGIVAVFYDHPYKNTSEVVDMLRSVGIPMSEVQ